jgi:hypothetical protein
MGRAEGKGGREGAVGACRNDKLWRNGNGGVLECPAGGHTFGTRAGRYFRTLYPKPNLSKPDKEFREKYPYLLRNIKIDHPNQAYCTDITYIPIGQGLPRSGRRG